jgi:hypothetical protein
MSKNYVNSALVQSASYRKNDTSLMYGYRNKGYTVTIRHANGAKTSISCKTKNDAKKVCEQAVGKL